MPDYLKLAQSGDAAATDPYLSLLESAATRQRAQASATLTAAVDTASDEYAAKKRVAGYLGYPVAAVEAQFEDAQRQAKTKQIEADTASSPALRRRYADADFAKLAHDDSGMLAKLARMFTTEAPPAELDTLRAWTGPAPTFASIARGLAMSPVQGFKAASAGLSLQIGDLFDGLGILPRNEAQKADAIRRAAQAGGASAYTTPEFESATAAAIYGGAASTLQQLPGLAMSVATRSPVPALATIGVQTEAQAYAKYRARGAAPGLALAGAAGEGAVEVGTELLPMGFLAKQLGRTGMKQFVVGLLARELPTEQAATLLQDAIDTAVANPDKTWADYVKERPGAAYATLVSTLTQSALMGGAHAALSRLARRGELVADAKQDAGAVQALAATAADSKLRERDPERFAEFVDEAAAASPVRELFIDANTFAQSMPPEKLAALPESITSQLEEALTTGGDVAISVGDFAAHLANHEVLAQHVRTSPEAMSPAEAEAYNADAELQQELDSVAAPPDASQAPVEAALAEARQTVIDALTAANRFTPAVNAQYADLIGAYLTTTAERAGLDVDRIRAMVPRIVSQLSTAGGVLEQASPRTATPEFNAWFGDSKAIDAAGAPLVVYHGTDTDFAEFDPSRLSATKHPTAGLGFFFSASPEVAGRFADTLKSAQGEQGEHIKPVHLSITNPHRMTNAEFNSLLATSATSSGKRRVTTIVRQFRKQAEEEGHDGIFIPGDPEAISGTGELNHDTWIAFKPTQIKSAIGNRGTFDGADPNILNQDRRGAFDPSTKTIALLERADLSTFIHEAGHFFLDATVDQADRADAPAGIKADVQTLLDWFGVPDLATWQAMTLDQQREHHEKFAVGFETYAMEGKAPSVELATAFARFRSWLLSVYRKLTTLGVELNPDVRGVMDRMLATDAQIADAEAQRNLQPLFASAEQAGMTPAEFAAYQATGQQATETAVTALQARTLRDMHLVASSKAGALSKLNADARAKRKAIEAEVAAEVMAQPIYQAWRDLARGKTDDGQAIKLSLPDLKENFAELADRVPHGMATNSPDALPADLVAEAYGLSSGDELVKLLATLDRPAIVIEGQTDQRMLEEHGELSDQRSVDRAANEAIANDTRLRFLEREVNALGKAVGNRPMLGRAARAYAEAAVARKKVRELRPGQYTAAEARAGRDAVQAFKAGDTAAAAAAKRTQLLQHVMARSTAAARAEVERAVDYLKKFDNDATRKAIGPDYAEQIDAILERFDLRTGESLRAIDRRKSLAEWVTAQEEIGFSPVIDDRLLAEAQRQSFRDMTVEELRGVVDTVKNIDHLGRLKQRLLTVQDQRAFDALVTEASASIVANATNTIAQDIETNLPRDRAGKLLTQYLVSHRKLSSLIRQMDGGKDGGTMWTLFSRGMNAAGDTEAGMRADATERLSALFAPVNAEGKLYDKTFIPEIRGSLTKAGRLAVALNWGNAANRQRLLDGDHWTQPQVQAVLDTLTQADWQFVQSVWDYVDSYWPAIAAKEQRVSGLTPEKVEAMQVQTKFGTFAGGYYPIKYDPDRSTKAGADSLAEAVKQSMQGFYTRATTRRGHTKARVDSVVDRPVRKDLGVVFEHVTQVAHDLAWHEWLIDANRLLRAKPIDAAIRTHYGPDVLRAMSAAFTDIAAGDVPAQNAFEHAMNHLRAGVSIASMGWSLVTAAQQPLGLAQSMVRIGPKWVGRGIARWLGDAARMQNTVAWIHERSEFMRLRDQTQNREINEIANQVRDSGGRSLLNPIPPAISNTFFYFTTRMQMVADVPTWLGQYEKSIDSGEPEARAMALADQAVIDAQSSGQIKDLAAIQRGGPLQKLFTGFYSAFSATYNLSAESIARTDFKKPGDVGRLAVDFLLLYTVPAVLGMALKDAMRGADDDELAKRLAREQLNYIAGTMVGVRELGAAISGTFGYSGPAGTRFFSDMAKLSKQVAQGEVDTALLKAANSAGGVLFHYPALQIGRTVEGIVELTEGTGSARGVLFGPTPKP